MSRQVISPENMDLVNGGKPLGETEPYRPYCKQIHEVRIVDGFVKYLGGRLYKCLEIIDKVRCFGTAAKWDPENPLRTADVPDNLSGFINSASPLDDQECRECIWLPHCQGGCPYQRLFGKKRSCPSYRNSPEVFLRTWYEKSVSRNGQKEE